MTHKPGPKEIRARELREQRAEAWRTKPPTASSKSFDEVKKAVAEATERTSKPKAKKKKGRK